MALRPGPRGRRYGTAERHYTAALEVADLKKELKDLKKEMGKLKGRSGNDVDASEVGQALAARMPEQTTENPLRDASAAYWRGRRAQLSVQGSGAV